MAISRSTRITILLVIDVFFFLVEVIVGYAVGSLALVADSFHMLNDVMSLVVALYAIKLAATNSTDSRYSYGWHRAEILAALINGVFLLALCFSISLEAMGRFFSTPEISNPRLIVVVGSLGLASNIVGLFLFHDHSHSHDTAHVSRSPSMISPSPAQSILGDQPPTAKVPIPPRRRSQASVDFALYGHPVATRASLVQTAADMARAESRSPTSRLHSIQHLHLLDSEQARKDTPVIEEDSEPHVTEHTEETPLLSGDHNGKSDNGGHGHSHAGGSMNMRALVLHVIGDALGNVGVIATGLVIWLTEWSFKYYFDPIISLVITVIIFSSALPLVESASYILLQRVPDAISLDNVRDSILAVEGVLSVHELHVWQLSESKNVASVHVLTSREHDFMPVAAQIRKRLHQHGIHSSTIQPEYYHPSSGAQSKVNGSNSCLILCPSDQNCNPENACCPPPSEV